MPFCSEHLTAGTFVALVTACIVAALLTGSTLQWVIADQGLFRKGACDQANQYNIIVAIAAVSSMTHTLNCFALNVVAPHATLAHGLWANLIWMVMTQSSILLVSRKLSLTAHRSSDRVWRRLLWINYALVPFQIVIGVTWTLSQTIHAENETITQISLILEPVQIALFGIIEFVLSGAFLVQMWKYQWTQVERRAIYVLLGIAACDVATVLMNQLIGDLESTCLKGCVYALRIRLEVSVLGALVEYIQTRRGHLVLSRANIHHNHTTTPTGSTVARQFLRDQMGNIFPFSRSRPFSRDASSQPATPHQENHPIEGESIVEENRVPFSTTASSSKPGSTNDQDVDVEAQLQTVSQPQQKEEEEEEEEEQQPQHQQEQQQEQEQQQQQQQQPQHQQEQKQQQQQKQEVNASEDEANDDNDDGLDRLPEPSLLRLSSQPNARPSESTASFALG